jgi:hypothetical protein
MNIHETQDTNRYGAFESNGLVHGQEYHAAVDYNGMTLAEVRDAGGQITRVRILTERINGYMYADISYVHATLPNGQTVNVLDVNVPNLTPYNKLVPALIEWGKANKVYVKGLGLLDKSNWSVLT